MDIFEKGRQDILKELNDHFTRIGAHLARELDTENGILIRKDALKDLRARAATADELEDEVSSFARLKRIQAAKLGELEAFREANAGSERLAEDNARLKEELELHKAAFSRVEKLEKENRRLGEELRQSHDRSRDTATPARATAGNFPPNSSGSLSSVGKIEDDASESVLRAKHVELVRKFNALYTNHKEKNAAVEDARRQIEVQRSKVKEWSDYHANTATKQKENAARIKELEAEVRILRAKNQELNDGNMADELPMLLSGGQNEGDQVLDGNDREIAIPDPGTYFTTVEASIPTSPAIPDGPQIKQEPAILFSPDAPVFVEARSIRKRKFQADTANVNDVSTCKIETITSSPIGLAALYNMEESLDLDDIGEKQSTPRKGRPAEQTLRIMVGKAGPVEGHNQDHSPSTDSVSSVKTPTSRIAGRKNSVLQSRSANKQILPRTSVDRPKKKRRTTALKDIDSLLEDGRGQSTPRKKPPVPEQDRILMNLLETRSPVRQVPSPLAPPKSRSSALSSRAYEAHRDSASDSATVHQDAADRLASLYPPTSSKRGKDSANSSRPVSRGDAESAETLRPTSRMSLIGVLRTGLYSSSVQTPRIPVDLPRPSSKDSAFRPPRRDTDSANFSSRPTSRDSTAGHTEAAKPTKISKRTPRPPLEPFRPSSWQSVEDSMDVKRPLPKNWNFQVRTPATLSSIRRLPQREDDTPSAIRMQPLRTRPLEDLTIQDFKVNPNYTGGGGYGYAFNEVVRKENERKCLQGCTKPECCGNQFRALAQAMRNPNHIPNLSQEERDEQILEEYMGDNAYKLRNMTKDERYEMLILANTRDLANKHGKHRHAFEGRSTPPGRWRADFPTTQEERQDADVLHGMERDEVRKRYEAAMRPGGAYIFRDE